MPVIAVTDTSISVALHQGETILAGLFRAGYSYRVGCRRGGCGICKLDIVEGEVDYARPVAESVLSECERAAGACLSCRAVPRSDVVIRLREGANLRHIVPLLTNFNTTTKE